jgi:hypothetical protein
MTTTTTTATGSLVQRWLQFLTSARPEATRAAPNDIPTYASVISAAQNAAGWDPHEVWLDRIKKPRDDRRAAELALEAAVRDVERPVKESR